MRERLPSLSEAQLCRHHTTGYTSHLSVRLSLVRSLRPIINSRPGPPTSGGRVTAAVSGLAALAGFVPLAVLSLVLTGLSAQAPDRSVGDGDPCCPHPDTWIETIVGTAGGLFGLAVASALLSTSIATFYYAFAGRRLRIGAALKIGALAALAFLALAALAVAVTSGF